MNRRIYVLTAAVTAVFLIVLWTGYLGIKKRAELGAGGRAQAPRSSANAPAGPGGPFGFQLGGVPDVRQSTDYSCGAAALQAVLSYWGIDKREGELMAALKTTPRQGTHPLDIVRVVRELGLKAELREGLTLADLEGALRRGIPPIVDLQAWTVGNPSRAGFAWADDWEDGHYVVLIGLDGQRLIFEDPSLLGTRGVIGRDEFFARWHDYEGEPPYRPSDPGDRAYVRMAIFIEGAKPAPPPPLTPIQ
jgi:predicted double-glycine peptidase